MFKRSIALIALLMAFGPGDASAQVLRSLLGASARTNADSTWSSDRADRKVLESVRAGKKTRVIIRVKPGARARVQAWAKAAAAGDFKMRGESRVGETITLELPAAVVKQLAKQADTLGISIDAPVGATQLLGGLLGDSPTTSSAPAPSSTNPENPYAGSATYDGQAIRNTLGLKTTDVGRGVGVAIIDSGIAPTADLTGRIAAFYDFTGDGAPVATAPHDGYGHGTHIAGLIAGSGQSSNGKYVGVATAARLIGLKVLNAQGGGYSSDVLEAVDFAVANKAALGIDVINMSLGHPIYEPAATDPLVQAVERAVKAGIVVVVSAGNVGMNRTTGLIGYAGITSPGNAPSALTVGSARTKATATRKDDEVSPFSSRGPTWFDGRSKPDVIAPGQALVATAEPFSTLGANVLHQVDLPGYIKLSGTSMAAGVASGIVANLIDTNRRDEGADSVLTPNTIKAMLMFTAIPVTDPDPATPVQLEQGAGQINAAGAIKLAKAINPRTLKGLPWLTEGVEMFEPIADSTEAWGQHIVWGDHVVWGDTALYNNEAWAEHVVWGDADHVVWGDSFTAGLNLVLDSVTAWGDQIVWSNSTDHIVWGDSDHIVWGDSDHIVWGDSDHIVWGDSALGIFGL
jgi:serine protease AprX